MTSLSTDSRCTQGRPVRYSWAGESTVRLDAHTMDVAAAVAEQFASKAANQELVRGKIDSKHFSKYRSKLKAFLENKLNRLQEGKLTPGSEVIPIKRASRDARIFELRWHHETTIHKSTKAQIRHYVGEPPEIENSVFGLVIHLKDTSGPETEITEKQNEQIDKSLNIYSKHSANGWKLN